MHIQYIETAPSTMPAGPFAQAAKVGQLVFVAGQVAYDTEADGPVSQDVAEQTRQAVRNLKTVLAAAGCELRDIATLTCILTDLSDDYASFNAAFSESFEGQFPPRTTIQAGLLGGYRVEIQATAIVRESRDLDGRNLDSAAGKES